MHKKQAFTLIELLVVIGIIAVLAAIALPVFLSARAKAHQSACLSNVRQVGIAILAYTQDFDEATPRGASRLLGASTPLNMGWAGRVLPYLKTADVLHCPGDPTQGDARKGTVPVSYALNLNFAETAHAAALTAPAHTVLAFEVTGNKSRVQQSDEAVEQIRWPETLSAAGLGTEGFLLDVASPPPPNAPSGGRVTRYATGYIDNYATNQMSRFSDFEGPTGRHQNGANFLAADGHTLWLRGTQVSAGCTAQTSSELQKESGCKNSAGAGSFPCAEGASVGQHALTFSIR